MTAKLAAGWTYSSCVVQELAVRCLLDQIEVTLDTYDQDLDPKWRGILTDRILEEPCNLIPLRRYGYGER
ncbi:hypothetical protein QFZ33_002278 [Arthrobacter globiformis]|nr:hypothetical protein [Arthrobacter globiformis]